MIGWLIIACEIGFWLFIVAGLTARYILKKPKASSVLLICTPLTDLVLLVATVADLRNGATASIVHGLAAIYLGVSIVYGHKMIKWADRQFEYRFAGGQKPVRQKKYGYERAREERRGWYQHLLAWMIGCIMLLAMILFIDGIRGIEQILIFIKDIAQAADTEPLATAALARTIMVWSLALAIDFAISFSYTIFPAQAQNHSDRQKKNA